MTTTWTKEEKESTIPSSVYDNPLITYNQANTNYNGKEIPVWNDESRNTTSWTKETQTPTSWTKEQIS